MYLRDKVEKTFASRLKFLREEINFSVENLAKKIDIKPEKIVSWESGDCVIDINELLTISRLFDVSVGFLLGCDVRRRFCYIDYGFSNKNG